MIFSAVAIIPSTFITDSLSISSYAIDILGNPGFLCLFGSRMFINLIEAGYSNTESETITDDQSSGGGIISNVRFEDFSYPRFGMNFSIFYKTESKSLIPTSWSNVHSIANYDWDSE